MSVSTHIVCCLMLTTFLSASEGQVVVWGRETWPFDASVYVGYHYVKDVPTDLGDVVDIAAGYQFLLALRSDGTVRAWGDNTYHQCDVPAGLADVVAISAGSLHSLALRSDGSVVAWGGNDYGQSAVPTVLPPILAVSANRSASGALDANGRVWYWGEGADRVPVTPTAGWRAIETCNFFENNVEYGCSIGRLADGSPAVWCTSRGDGLGRDKILAIPTTLETMETVAMGSGWAVGVNSVDGAAVAWGENGGGTVTACAGQANLCQVDLETVIQVGRTRMLGAVAWEGISSVGNWVGMLPPAGLTQVRDVAAGDFFGAALVRATPPAPRVVWVAKSTDAQPAQTVVGHVLVTGDDGNCSAVSLVSGPGGADNHAVTLDQHRILAGEEYGSHNQRSFQLSYTDQLGQTATAVVQQTRQLTVNPGWVQDRCAAGTVAGRFQIGEAAPPIGTTFTLVPGAGADNNGAFAVSDGALVTTTSLNLSDGAFRRVRVRTVLAGGQTSEDVIDVGVKTSEASSSSGGSGSGCGMGGAGLILLVALGLCLRVRRG